MKFRFTISRKIGFGFAVVLITTLVVFLLTYDTLRTGRKINDKINRVYNPSVSSLEVLKSTVLRSRTLINMWAFVQSREDTKEKMSLVRVINVEIPQIKHGIDSLSVNWTQAERRKKERIYQEMETLLNMYAQVQTTLDDMPSYDDPFTRFTITEYAEEDGLIYDKARDVLDLLNELINEQRSNITSDSITMIQSFNTLEGYLRNMGVAIFLFGIVIAILTVRSITKPVKKLKLILLDLGKGKFPEKGVLDTGDEVGEMSIALDAHVNALKRTSEFANQVGKGNFETSYMPLSQEDVLGNSLLVMRDGLKRNEQQLEKEVEDRTHEIVKQKNKIEKQNEQRKELLENITASIRYAKRLQENILPTETQVSELLRESFIYYRPKDIVSGDFYFVKELNDKIVFAAVDCTGHGVPGAFMSLVGHNSLNHALANNPEMDPGSVLNDLSRFAAEAMNQKGHEASVRDGMDMALCIYDSKNSLLEYAGAQNPLYLIRNGKLKIYRADKMAIADTGRHSGSFTSHSIELQENDMIYIFSDGYVDQFGGPQGKKFYYEPFRNMLIEISGMRAEDQLRHVESRMESWRMSSPKHERYEQVDDMLIIGMRHILN